MKRLASHPALWLPTLYFAEGIPYFIVNNISVIMLTRMGVSNAEMSLFTSLLYLPWVIKPFWSPFVDILRTKRWWIIAMQMVIALAMAGVAMLVPRPSVESIQGGATTITLFYPCLILFVITAFASATHDIAADGFYMLALSEGQQSEFVGLRSLFYRLSNVFCNSALVFLAGKLETSTNDIPLAWQITILCTAVLFAAIAVWHSFFVPRPDADVNRGKADIATTARNFFATFATFFTKKGIVIAIIFMLLYRLPEAFLLKLVSPFMLNEMHLSTELYGLVYGVVGVVALLAGGIIGGVYASRVGLKRALLPMAAALVLPCAVYVWFAAALPSNLIVISTAIAIEQFGYGFGFTAYMLYMIYVSDGEFRTSHYALCTGFMALSMMLPGAVAGYIQEATGYYNFFWIVMASGVLTAAVTLVVRAKVPDDFGVK